MKILIASDSYKQINGVSNSVNLLVQGLREAGHEVKVLALSDTMKSYKDGDDYFAASVDALIYPDMRVSVMLKDEYLEELVEWHPDIAHIQTEFSAKFLAMKVVRQCDIPYVMTSHTNYEEYFKSKKINATLARGIIKSFERIVYDNADTLIVPSEKIRELVEEYQVKCPVVVIPTGIELGNHPRMNEDKAQLLARYGVENNGKVLVSVSRISREKNIDELIDYMPVLLIKKPCRLLMEAALHTLNSYSFHNPLFVAGTILLQKRSNDLDFWGSWHNFTGKACPTFNKKLPGKTGQPNISYSKKFTLSSFPSP